MESALATALAEARRAGAARLCVLSLRVGDLSGVVPEALEMAFETLALDTIAEGGTLQIERVPAIFWCADCRREFPAGRMFALCPDCSNPCHDLRAGRELEISSLEIE